MPEQFTSEQFAEAARTLRRSGRSEEDYALLSAALKIASRVMEPGAIETAVALNDNEPKQDWGHQAQSIRKALAEGTGND